MRRKFLSLLLGLPGLGVVASAQTATKMKVLIKSAWGSSDPTQAAFAFHHARAFAEGGHDVQIFLLGEGVTVMRSVVANSIHPVGWPPLSEALQEVIAKKIPIHV
jgi:predicted peroxiredoxin